MEGVQDLLPKLRSAHATKSYGPLDFNLMDIAAEAGWSPDGASEADINTMRESVEYVCRTRDGEGQPMKAAAIITKILIAEEQAMPKKKD